MPPLSLPPQNQPEPPRIVRSIIRRTAEKSPDIGFGDILPPTAFYGPGYAFTDVLTKGRCVQTLPASLVSGPALSPFTAYSVALITFSICAGLSFCSLARFTLLTGFFSSTTGFFLGTPSFLFTLASLFLLTTSLFLTLAGLFLSSSLFCSPPSFFLGSTSSFLLLAANLLSPPLFVFSAPSLLRLTMLQLLKLTAESRNLLLEVVEWSRLLGFVGKSFSHNGIPLIGRLGDLTLVITPAKRESGEFAQCSSKPTFVVTQLRQRGQEELCSMPIVLCDWLRTSPTLGRRSDTAESSCVGADDLK